MKFVPSGLSFSPLMSFPLEKLQNQVEAISDYPQNFSSISLMGAEKLIFSDFLFLSVSETFTYNTFVHLLRLYPYIDAGAAEML